MQLVSIAMRGPNLTAFQFWATRWISAVVPPDEPDAVFGFDRGLSGISSQNGSIPGTGAPDFIVTAVTGALADGLLMTVVLLNVNFVFEFTTTGVVGAGRFPILINALDTAAQVATAIADAIEPSVFGFAEGGITSEVVAGQPTRVQIFATDNAFTGSARSFHVLVAAPMLVSPDTTTNVPARPAIYGLPLLKSASKAFVFQGLVTTGDLPVENGLGDPITYVPTLLSVVAWPVRCGAGGKRAWVPQLRVTSFIPAEE